ncbi:DUF3710 domain-containing protein [Nocardioides sp. SR21]|uniref:DUF3710 domain-containing protein n=1 Tax=Nocardioides sp. SR21 TaxID=2919501 RepID=UPI001FAA64EA|nr:DUF3710 domain-containing protein [Nocardioides sp. SR21]
MKFRRKSADPVEPDVESSAETTPEDETQSPARTGGPYDINDVPADDVPRLDIGSLLIPGAEGFELRLQIDEATQEVRSALLTQEDGAIELRAFAATRNGDLWSEVRPRIAADFAQRGGTASEREGRFGTELVCQLTVKTEDGRTGTQASRIVGINGERWMLRVTMLGRPAVDEVANEVWSSIVEQVVVRRGDQPMPPGTELPLQVPSNG